MSRIISDENVNQLLNRDGKELFVALLINRQISRLIFSGNFKMLNLQNRGEM